MLPSHLRSQVRRDSMEKILAKADGVKINNLSPWVLLVLVKNIIFSGAIFGILVQYHNESSVILAEMDADLMQVRSDLVELMHLSCPSVSVEALGDSRKISLAPREADGTPTFTGILSCNEETARMAIDLEERLYAFEAEKKSTKLEMLFMTLWGLNDFILNVLLMYALRYLERTETGRRIVLSTLVSLCVKFVTLLLYSAPPSPESLISEGVENLFLYAFILTLVLPISDCSGLILFRYRREYLSWTLSDFCYEVVVLWWYLAHVNFFFWLMDYYVDMWGSQDRQKKKTLAKEQFSIAMEKRPIRARPEWFFHACLYGHNSVIRKIFKENPYFDVNQTVRSNSPSLQGLTGLHVAAAAGQVSVVQLLLDSRRKVNLYHKGPDGLDCVAVAASAGHLTILRKIFKSKRFTWKRVDVVKTLLSVIKADRFEAADFILRESQLNCDPEIARSLVRCLNRARELQKLREGEKREVCQRMLEASKEYLLKLLLQSEKTKNECLSDTATSDTTEAASQIQSYPVVSSDLLEHFECPVCLEEMSARIFACSNDHWICGRCLSDQRISCCPSCRENFAKVRPKRCLTAERIAGLIRGKQS